MSLWNKKTAKQVGHMQCKESYSELTRYMWLEHLKYVVIKTYDLIIIKSGLHRREGKTQIEI